MTEKWASNSPKMQLVFRGFHLVLFVSVAKVTGQGKWRLFWWLALDKILIGQEAGQEAEAVAKMLDNLTAISMRCLCI